MCSSLCYMHYSLLRKPRLPFIDRDLLYCTLRQVWHMSCHKTHVTNQYVESNIDLVYLYLLSINFTPQIVLHMMMSSIILATTNCTSEYVIYKKINKTENTFYSIKFRFGIHRCHKTHVTNQYVESNIALV
jgi:hypothetical protein